MYAKNSLGKFVICAVGGSMCTYRLTEEDWIVPPYAGIDLAQRIVGERYEAFLTDLRAFQNALCNVYVFERQCVEGTLEAFLASTNFLWNIPMEVCVGGEDEFREQLTLFNEHLRFLFENYDQFYLLKWTGREEVCT